MNSGSYHPGLHRMAVLTTCASLLPIGVGALVTTRGAGMAFPDWPSSDGYLMLSYPWLQSVGDKFLEHGHRLAGVVVGCFALGLAGVALAEKCGWRVRLLCLLVLVGVIVQGVLGGSRVLLNDRGLAFVHGSFAALVFGLMGAVAVVTSRRWLESTDDPGPGPARPGLAIQRGLACVTCLLIFLQYVLGGLVRHQGTMLYHHLGFAFVVLLAVLADAAAAWGMSPGRLGRPAACLVGLIVLQLALGVGAWATRFGLGEGVVVHGSPTQVTMRTMHVLGGMLVFLTAIVLALKSFTTSGEAATAPRGTSVPRPLTEALSEMSQAPAGGLAR